MPDYPAAIVPVNHVEPCPRRLRAELGGETVLDTLEARYVWEWPYYPHYYVPLADVRPAMLESEGHTERDAQGLVEVHSLRAHRVCRAHAAKVVRETALPALEGTVRFEWGSLDAWYEEDEPVFVHARNPYVRVDALRSTRTVRIELDGIWLAKSSSPVMVFETGLPTRYYVNRTDVDFTHLVPSETVTECPYKGTTSAYWSVDIGGPVHSDLVWSYDFPTRQLMPVTGLLAFYNEAVDTYVDGRLLERPQTHFFDSDE